MDIRDKLLAAAARVYAEVGFRGATTRRIAQEAGVNEITLFRHFGSKAALLHEAIAHAGLHSVEPLPEDPGDAAAELLVWARQTMTELRAKRSLIRTCMAEAEERPGVMGHENGGPPDAWRTICRYIERLRGQGRAADDVEPAAAAALLMGALFADAMGRDVMPEMYANDPDEAIVRYVQLFLRAIGTTA
jgi:AcrR family transcriptional regulator